ncbi:hypothetical protein RND81_02G145100 [Saponaria officinalis]|uniref:Retrotransposon Copia-like N-terminal domain-containing protein n=1 Tax=Saponaria officinalis TaxID=3572 RepID=A0AAW1MU82_SAPOF
MTSSSDESEAVVHTAPSYEYYDDPLSLSSSDQPNLQLLGHCFNGTNFITWKRDAYIALMAKNKEGFVDGTCKKPEKSDKKYHQWIRCDLVMRWLLNSIEGGIKDTLMYVNSSKELWNELIERYGQTNSLEIYQLKKNLHNITQDNLPLIEYYSKLKHAWESIDSLDPIPTCSCGLLDACTCALLKRVLERDSNNKLIQLLMGLKSVYEGVKTTILSMEPLPPINKALALLQKIERQKQIADAVDVLAEANAYAVGKQFDDYKHEAKKAKLDISETDRRFKKCSHCHNSGHTKEECYKLKECTFCGKKDSTELTPLSDAPGGVVHSPLPLVDTGLMDGIVNNVMQQMLKVFSDKTSAMNVSNFAGTLPHSLINSAYQSTADVSWIMDTGASDHMTHNINCLTDVHVLSRLVLVALPDGTVKMVHQAGTHCLTPSITLHNVLFVHEFRHNLLSVGRLVSDSHLVAIFDTHTCVLQDLLSKILRGVERDEPFTCS